MYSDLGGTRDTMEQLSGSERLQSTRPVASVGQKRLSNVGSWERKVPGAVAAGDKREPSKGRWETDQNQLALLAASLRGLKAGNGLGNVGEDGMGRGEC